MNYANGHAKYMSSHLDGDGARWMEGYRGADGTTTTSSGSTPTTPIASGTAPTTSTGTQPRRYWGRPPYGAWGYPYWPYPTYDTPILVGVANEEPAATTIIKDKKNNTLQYAVIALAAIGAIVIVKKLIS